MITATKLLMTMSSFAVGAYLYVAIIMTLKSSNTPTKLPPTTLPAQSPEIDLVVTYVNGSDEIWKQAYSDERSKHEQLLPHAATKNRFEDHDDLRYLLRSVDLYGNRFFRRVHLVVAFESQVPAWLRRDHPRLNIVYHREIFRNASDLPTFNSLAIEANLHHIDGLAEYFIYTNDDFAFLREIQLDDFVGAVDPRSDSIRSLIVRNNREIKINNLRPNETSAINADFINGAIIARDLLSDLVDVGRCSNKSLKRIAKLLEYVPSHTPRFFVRSILLKAEQDELVLAVFRRTWSERFRNGREIDVAHFFGAFCACATSIKVFSTSDESLIYVTIDEALLPELLYTTKNMLDFKENRLNTKSRLRYLCVNDITTLSKRTEAGTSFSKHVKHFRDRLFPRASSFELE